ncbi:hypothetical protein AB7M45_007750 [Bradyrhizobium elkanii]|uniref:hypothetical protein n=1 Tax=Bradyrhizobium elkanii TaxID=29448 RepID=UPI000F74531B|nr:hypothetical protein [Bradyrhizobium elkanii]MCW2194977.1 hypothetical protein [Bradyrhizobium elkanii]NWL67324.1 hypothetical protein [Bradyrhizobium elkanii]
MKKLFAIGACALLLSGCNPSAEQRARVNSQLPPGCTIRELGTFGSIENLVAVICDGRSTKALNFTETHSTGKVTVTKQMAVLQVD